jgi:uncharacterized protein (TIGR00290 family)
LSERVALSWSGGKDSAVTLARLRGDPRWEVAVLLTTVTEGYDRISLHGVRRLLLEAQAHAIGVPLIVAYIPPDATEEIYRIRMEQAFRVLLTGGITTVAFGDLFLEDVRRYREGWLRAIGMKPIFPLWQQDTRCLAETIVRDGFAAILTCVDTTWLRTEFAGRQFDVELLRDLPGDVDPCGERGEFHTFVYDGPIFCHRVPVCVGERVQRGVRTFCDLTLSLSPESKGQSS